MKKAKPVIKAKLKLRGNEFIVTAVFPLRMTKGIATNPAKFARAMSTAIIYGRSDWGAKKPKRRHRKK